jgi:hypothetical protein
VALPELGEAGQHSTEGDLAPGTAVDCAGRLTLRNGRAR